MNEPTPLQNQPLDLSARGMWHELKDFAQREPMTAVAAVATVGLLIKLLPNRWLVTTASVVGSALVRPAILTLAVTKLMELCVAPKPVDPSES